MEKNSSEATVTGLKPRTSKRKVNYTFSDVESSGDEEPDRVSETSGEEKVCGDCNSVHLGKCPARITLSELDPTAGVDQASLAYTQLPVPAELTVKESGIPGAGLGVFANKFIPRNVKMGPYEGKRVCEEDMGEILNTAYVWEVKCEGGGHYLIDASDPAFSNWVRFVNCARSEDEQNMAAFQYEGQIFFYTIKSVYPGSELLVWYGDHYAKELGISVDRETMEANHECLGCGATFVAKISLDLHIRLSSQCSVANPSTYECGRCKQKFGSMQELQEHIAGHSAVPASSKICVYCGKNLRHSSSLQKHLRIHSGDKPYKCECCGKCFTQKGNLQRHLRIHSGDKPYKCDYCDKSFVNSGNLLLHLRIHSGSKPYKCAHCGKCFSVDGKLKTHLRIHSGDKPYKCERCGKCFTDSCHLKQHLQTHSGDKPYKCEHCGRCFSRLGSLQRHLRIHSGEKPFKCEQCGMRFTNSSTLGRHLKIHSGDKPYPCDHCGRCFSRLGSLQRHLRMHSGEKSYKCEQCDERFRNSGALRQHLRTHSGEKL